MSCLGLCILFQTPIQLLENVSLPQRASCQILLRIIDVLLSSSACNFLAPVTCVASVSLYFLNATVHQRHPQHLACFLWAQRQARQKPVSHADPRSQFANKLLCASPFSEGNQEWGQEWRCGARVSYTFKNPPTLMAVAFAHWAFTWLLLTSDWYPESLHSDFISSVIFIWCFPVGWAPGTYSSIILLMSLPSLPDHF